MSRKALETLERKNYTNLEDVLKIKFKGLAKARCVFRDLRAAANTKRDIEKAIRELTRGHFLLAAAQATEKAGNHLGTDAGMTFYLSAIERYTGIGRYEDAVRVAHCAGLPERAN